MALDKPAYGAVSYEKLAEKSASMIPMSKNLTLLHITRDYRLSSSDDRPQLLAWRVSDDVFSS